MKNAQEMTLYHVTPYHTYQTKIKRHGLIPRIGAKSKKVNEPVKRIYLFDSIDECENALMNWLGDEYEDIGVKSVAILKVDLENIDIEQNPDAGYEYWVTDPIPPDKIKLIKKEMINESFVPDLKDSFLKEVFLPAPSTDIKSSKITIYKNMKSSINY